ncbi:hypothetical protein [Candidatus Binatus sp.]|uniref:hypothetical protein n=1 Tax=Candidatus Binatus sp. TaxID=2811406 RepID=UPI002F938912
MKRFAIAFLSIIALPGCALPPPPAQQLSTNGQPILVTTTNDVPGREIQILGMVSAYNNDCGEKIGAAALRKYPLTEAVIGYHEQQSTSCSGGTFGGMPYTLCGEACEGTAVEFVERDDGGTPR